MSVLLEDFEGRLVAGDGADIFVRTAGSGPAVLLIHGFPQTGIMWHAVAPALAREFAVAVADLRGYGASSCPADDAGHHAYSKRAMARDLVAVMAGLGHDRFLVCGHDRGARVGYRMALDHPDKVAGLCVLDIVPTLDQWQALTGVAALKDVYHWPFLAQDAPLPETLIGADPIFYLEWTLASWTKARDLSAFNPQALAAYRAAFAQPKRITAACADYRAGASADLAADQADRAAGRRIACPVLALWGESGIPGKGGGGPLAIWREWADEVDGGAIDAGHFVAEENPAAVLDRLLPFLRRR